jgi:hypothetical protein
MADLSTNHVSASVIGLPFAFLVSDMPNSQSDGPTPNLMKGAAIMPLLSTSVQSVYRAQMVQKIVSF